MPVPDSAITQYFYNVEAYFYFLDQCAASGHRQAHLCRVMPITNFANLLRFSRNCGAEIPRWICQRMEAYGDDQESIRKFGLEVVTQLCQTLLDSGAPGIHFYTMNQVEPTRKYTTTWACKARDGDRHAHSAYLHLTKTNEQHHLELEPEPSRHLARALRIQEGDPLTLFDGRGGEYPATVTAVDKKRVQVQVGSLLSRECESALHIHMGIAISRGERMDWVIQKATELGVSSMTPLVTERSGVKLAVNGQKKSGGTGNK